MSDSDDDLPISELIKKRKLIAKAANNDNLPSKPKNNANKSDPEKKKQSGSVIPKSSSSNSNGGDASRSLSTRFYEDTEKGRMIQSLLVRWWYSIEWPTDEEIADSPPGYEPLDGFKGVFVSTRTDSLGEIIDLRDKETCPNLKNLSKYHSSKIQSLLIAAYEKQLSILEEANNSDDNVLISTLQSDLKQIKRINAEKAEKEASKFKF